MSTNLLSLPIMTEPVIHSTMSTNLMSLPTEVRQIIYEHLFSSYVIRHGHGHNAPRRNQNRAALLLTCKTIYAEAWRLLPQKALLHFHGTESFIETLMSMYQNHITHIRHVRVTSFPFPLHGASCTEFRHMYYFADAIKLFAGLNLDQLTVDDAFHGFGLVEGWRDVVTYFDIEGLLKSDGWRELIYITPNTDFMTSGYDHRQKRLSQPENWHQMLLERDGEHSGADVSMFITPEEETTGDTHGEPAVLLPWEATPGHEVIPNPTLAKMGQEIKGIVTVVARRGKYKAVAQLGSTRLGPWRNWKEMKNAEGGFQREDWTPYYNDMADAVSWIYGGWGRRMMLAQRAFNY